MNGLRRCERFVVGDHVRIDDGSEWVLTAAAVSNPWVWVSGDSAFCDQLVSSAWIRQRQARLLSATVHVDGSELLHCAAEQCASRAAVHVGHRGVAEAWSTAARQVQELLREGWGAEVVVTGQVTRSGP